MDEWLNAANVWVIYVVCAALLVAAAEAGFAIARWHRVRRVTELDRFVVSLAAPTIGLLGLMIGFTFSMALTRFETRVIEVVDEANLIEKAALRGQMLPEPYKSTVAPLFKEYARTRVAPSGERVGSSEEIARAHKTLEIQGELWQQGLASAATNPQVVPTGMFIEALNEIIDAYGKRTAIRRNRVPAGIFLFLLVVAIIAVGYSGYGAYGGDPHRRVAMGIMGAMIGLGIALTVDMDRPQRGLITVSQQPLLDLVERMK
jgi:hypothetical protein